MPDKPSTLEAITGIPRERPVVKPRAGFAPPETSAGDDAHNAAVAGVADPVEAGPIASPFTAEPEFDPRTRPDPIAGIQGGIEPGISFSIAPTLGAAPRVGGLVDQLRSLCAGAGLKATITIHF